MTLHVCMAPRLLDEPAQCALDCAMWPVSGSPVFATKKGTGSLPEAVRTCLHHCPSSGQIADKRPA